MRQLQQRRVSTSSTFVVPSLPSRSGREGRSCRKLVFGLPRRGPTVTVFGDPDGRRMLHSGGFRHVSCRSTPRLAPGDVPFVRGDRPLDASAARQSQGTVGAAGHHVAPVHGSFEGGTPTFMVPVSVAVDFTVSTGPPFLPVEVST
jgi:hypothetical protein